MDRSGELKDKILEWGGSDVGFSRVEDFLPQAHKHLKWAVTVVFRLSDQIINDISEGPTHTYFHHYRHVNALLDQITLRASSLIQEWGHLAMAVPASQTVDREGLRGFFQHKTAATRAGLGWIGKNALLITGKYGPRVRLATILTDMPLPEGVPVEESGCGNCKECVLKCPALALRGENWAPGKERSLMVDALACSTYMKEYFGHIGRGSVCGMCIEACPRGRDNR